MRIVDGKALLLKLRNPKRVTETIPKSKSVQDHEVLVKWGIDEAHTLRKLNINVPTATIIVSQIKKEAIDKLIANTDPTQVIDYL